MSGSFATSPTGVRQDADRDPPRAPSRGSVHNHRGARTGPALALRPTWVVALSDPRRAGLSRTDAAVALGLTPDFLVDQLLPALAGGDAGRNATTPLVELRRWLAATVA